MNNLNKLPDNSSGGKNESLYLSFAVGDNKYAVSTLQVLEIMKLPLLDYPQRLPNNIIGLLNYNNFTINVLDIRFYLNTQITPYSTTNQLLIVKTDDSIFGLIINKVEDIITISDLHSEHFQAHDQNGLIDFLFKNGDDTVSILNLFSLENLLKKGVEQSAVDIVSLFPQDDESRYKLMQRNHALVEKNKADLAKTIFSQRKFVSISLNSNIYCIAVEYVKEFIKNASITLIPCSPDYIAGLMTLRGDFVSVINIKKFLNLTSSGKISSKNRVVVVQSPEYKIGFLVDEIFSIIDIAEEIIEQNAYQRPNKYIMSEVVQDEKLYTILDMKTILSDEKFYIEEKV